MLIIIGSNGQLGWELVRQSRIQGLEAQGLDCPGIDIAIDGSARSCLEPLPAEIIVNAAAYTAVDRAESEPDRAFAVNRTGVRNLALYCRERQIPMIHISTDYVFDGSKKGAYLEEDPVAPVGVYGRSKEAGERELRGILENHVILRTAWLYGTHGRNFVKTIVEQAREREVLRVVADQWGCPTYAADLADAVLQIARRYMAGEVIPWGTYHYCGAGATTWHGFAEAIIALAQEHEKLKVKEIVPLTTAEYPTPARRPANSVLDCSKIERCFGIRPRLWRESLAEMMGRLISSFQYPILKELV
jgi:dTDP-4-dehydrorhamnose reductase